MSTQGIRIKPQLMTNIIFLVSNSILPIEFQFIRISIES